MLERAYSLVDEYSRFDYIHITNRLTVASSSWDFLTTTATTRRVLFISLKLPPLGFIKVNFDGNVKNARGGASYAIQGPDSNLLVAGRSHLFEPSIPRAELRASWASIICARQVLWKRGSLLRMIPLQLLAKSRMS